MEICYIIFNSRSCVSNQLVKINEFFLSLELFFKVFVCHLSQS